MALCNYLGTGLVVILLCISINMLSKAAPVYVIVLTK